MDHHPGLLQCKDLCSGLGADAVEDHFRQTFPQQWQHRFHEPAHAIAVGWMAETTHEHQVLALGKG